MLAFMFLFGGVRVAWMLEPKSDLGREVEAWMLALESRLDEKLGAWILVFESRLGDEP